MLKNKSNLTMKRFIYVLIISALLGGSLASCRDWQSDIDRLDADYENLSGRVSAIEEWQKSVNGEITTLQNLIENLRNQNWITDVKPVTVDGVSGYRISFAKGESVEILNGRNGADGKDGHTPVIGVEQDTNGIYYWTVWYGEGDPVWLLDADGNKMRVSGRDGKNGNDGKDAISPQLRINSQTGEWELSTDGGTTWTSTGVKATGDKGDKGDKGDTGEKGNSFFSEVDYTTNPDIVTFTLADGGSFSIPRHAAKNVSFLDADGNTTADPFTMTSGANTMTVQLTGLKNWKTIYAELTNDDGTSGIDIKTRATDDVIITEPDESGKATVTINKSGSGVIGIVRVTVIDSDNSEYSASRAVIYYVSVTSVILNKTSLSLTAGQVERLTATVSPENAFDKAVTWASSNESVATVDDNGLVTAKAPGKATITVTSKDGGHAASCTITVKSVTNSFNPDFPDNGGYSGENEF
jgi:hypothetical protein